MIRPDTIMEACSMSKPFFAYMLLKLVEEKRFKFERPLVEYLERDYVADDPRHRRITARMSLSHTSGLPNWRSGGWRSGALLSLGFEPGAKFQYSGEGILMLQRAVEKALDADLDSLSRKRLIEPLKLKNTRYVWDDRFVVRSSCGHDRKGRVKTDRRYYDRANAAYTLYTSAEDYARFLVEILKTDRSAAHSISADMRTQMIKAVSHREQREADWGLGWGLRTLDGKRRVFHSGANGSGFHCYSEFIPETGYGFVIMTNSLNGDDLWNAVVNQWHAKAQLPKP
jgi:CubicO group peptidase (beta-lactamase class C family)